MYIGHLIALSEDPAVQGEDRARLKGYLKKWSDSRIVIGCALYIEVLKPPSFLSLGLQGSNVDVVLAIKQILKTVSALKSLASQDPLQWPVVKQVIDRISADDDENTYQGTVILGYCDATLNECKQQALSDLKILSENMLKRLEWSDMKLLRALLVFVDTQSWMKKQSEEEEEDDCMDDQSLAEVKMAMDTIFLSFICTCNE